MQLLIEKGIRGGIFQSVKLYAKAVKLLNIDYLIFYETKSKTYTLSHFDRVNLFEPL